MNNLDTLIPEVEIRFTYRDQEQSLAGVPFRLKVRSYIILCHPLLVRLRPSLRLNISVFPMACQLVSLDLLFVILVNFVLVILFCYCIFCFVLLL